MVAGEDDETMVMGVISLFNRFPVFDLKKYSLDVGYPCSILNFGVLHVFYELFFQYTLFILNVLEYIVKRNV